MNKSSLSFLQKTLIGCGVSLLVSAPCFALDDSSIGKLYEQALEKGLCTKITTTEKSGLVICELKKDGYKPTLDIHLTHKKGGGERILHITVRDMATRQMASGNAYLEGTLPGGLSIREGENKNILGVDLKSYISRLNGLSW